MDKTQLKALLAEAKGNLKAFRKEHKITDPDNVPEDLQEEFEELTLAVENAQDAYDEAVEATKKARKTNGGAKLYTYGQIKDLETGEMRDMTPQETKKWRTHARKVGAKEGLSGAEVPFDPDFFLPKLKAEKAPKPKKEKVKKVEVLEDED